MTKSNAIIIRRATVEDEKAIITIHKEAVEKGCKDFYRPEQIEAWAVPKGLPPFKEILKQTIFLVAELDGEVIAFSNMAAQTGTVITLFVNPSHMGFGIGTDLLNSLENIARESGLVRVSVDATLNSIRFYEHRGYRLDHDVAHTEPDGTGIECKQMLKEL